MNNSVFTRHIVADMDASMVQRCLICGEIISDYRNAMWPNGQDPPKGWGSGPVYVLGGNPTTYMSEAAMAETSMLESENCKPK